MERDSTAFLVDLFTGLRDDLAEQAGEGRQGRPEPKKAARELAIYEALLAGLTDHAPFPDDEELREHVAGLARAADEGNDYEQTVLEHRAFEELVAALAES